MKKHALLFLFVFSLITLTTSCGGGEATTEESPAALRARDSSDISATLKGFYNWYAENRDRLNDMDILVAPGGGKPYYMRPEGIEAYVEEFKKSGFVSEKYLNELKTFLNGRTAHYQETGQGNGPPEGLEVDPFGRTADGNSIPIAVLKEMNWKLNFTQFSGSATTAPHASGDGQQRTLTVSLVKEGGLWKLAFNNF